MKATFEIPIYGIIALCFIILRICVNQESYVVLVNSIIILLSLFLVSLSIIHHVEDNFIYEIEQSDAVPEVQDRERKKAHRNSCIFITMWSIVYFIILPTYITFFKSTLINDILSIFTFGLSLLDLTISNIISVALPKNLK